MMTKLDGVSKELNEKITRDAKTFDRMKAAKTKIEQSRAVTKQGLDSLAFESEMKRIMQEYDDYD